MEIYQLKVFLEVARCLSFTEAADALNLTQPAVSAKIRSLESELGTPLFHRLGRRIELTQIGQYLWEKGPDLVALESQLIREIEEIKQGKFGTLKVGCMADTASHWLPTLLFRYRQQYPQIQTRCLQFESAEQLYRAVTQGEADIGISDLSFSGFEEVSETIIDTVQYSLIVASSHMLAQQPWLSLKDLRDQPWVLLPDGTPSRIILEKRLDELGLSLADFAHVEIVDTPNLVRTYLLEGHYLSFISNLEFQVEQQTRLMTAISLEEFALGMPLFLLLSKHLSRCLDQARQPGGRSSQTIDPIAQFIKLLQSGIRRFGAPVPSESKLATAAPTSSPGRIAEGARLGPCPKVARFQSSSVLARSHSTPRTDTLTLTLGTQNRTIQTVTAGLIIQRLGLLEHFLPREGRYSGVQYQIQWWDYSSGAPIVEGLQSKQIDIGVLGDYPLLLSAMQPDAGTMAETRLISFVASNPDGAGNDVIVPHRSLLNSFEDLKGRVIAVPFSSAAHGMIMRSLHHENLLDEVKLTSIDSLNPRQLARHPRPVDGYAYFAPFHEIAKQGGGFRRLLQGNPDGLPTFHGVVAQQALADRHPEIVVAFLKALLAAQYWYTTTPIAPTLVSRWVNLDASIVCKTLCTHTKHYAEGIFFPETQVRTDWLHEHIKQLTQITGNEHLSQIHLDRWVQEEFLAQAIATL